MERELMLILGITTSTAQVGCAIGGHAGVLGAIHSSRGRRHAETLTPAIEFLCRQTPVALADIGAVAVDLVPGMFTGLRVSVVAGLALAHARRLPMARARASRRDKMCKKVEITA